MILTVFRPSRKENRLAFDRIRVSQEGGDLPFEQYTDIYTLYRKLMIYSVIDIRGIYLILEAQARVFIRYV